MGTEPTRHVGDRDRLGEALDDLADGSADAGRVRATLDALAASARDAGARAVVNGRWLAGLVVDLAPRVRIRDQQTLSAQHGGLEGADLASRLIRNAARASAGVGATAGAVVGAQQLAPPAWLAIPFELVIETLAVAAIELRLVAELHEVYGRPIGQQGDRVGPLVRAWAERRGVNPTSLARSGGLTDALGKGARNELIRLVRRRILRRLGANLSTLAPLLTGAAIGAEVNHRATRALGEAVLADLASGAPR